MFWMEALFDVALSVGVIMADIVAEVILISVLSISTIALILVVYRGSIGTSGEALRMRIS